MKLISHPPFLRPSQKGKEKKNFALMKLSRISPIMYSQGSSSFANNAVSMAADIIRESSFMQQLSDIKECDVEIKIIYCLDDASTVNHFN